MERCPKSSQSNLSSRIGRIAPPSLSHRQRSESVEAKAFLLLRRFLPDGLFALWCARPCSAGESWQHDIDASRMGQPGQTLAQQPLGLKVQVQRATCERIEKLCV
jgi:hypothetical protein